MAIKLTPSVSTPAVIEYLHTKDQVQSVNGLILSTSLCCYCKCDVCLPALADLSDSDVYKNDFYPFILSSPLGTTVTGTLIKIDPNGVETNIVIVDNTYGTFYDSGYFDRAEVWGFVLDWRKVATVSGFGRYRFNITIKNSSSTVIYNEDSPCFELQPWSCETEHSTVRLETTQQGYIHGGFDFRGLTPSGSGQSRPLLWRQQIRLYGELSRKFTTETDSIANNKYESRQIQTRIYKNWSLRLDWVPGKVTKFLTEEMLLSNPIKVSGFNQFSPEIWRDVQLKYLETGDPDKGEYNVYEFYTIEFEDFKKDKIKRHG